MKKFIMMIAAVAMAGMMSSCGDKAAAGADADSTKVEAAEGGKAAETAAPASDKPMKEQMKDAIVTIKSACDDEDYDNLKKGMLAYVESFKSAKSLDEFMSLDKEPDLDLEKVLKGVKDPEKWCTPEQLTELHEIFGPKMEATMKEVMTKLMPALQEAAEAEAEAAAEGE